MILILLNAFSFSEITLILFQPEVKTGKLVQDMYAFISVMPQNADCISESSSIKFSLSTKAAFILICALLTSSVKSCE